jgi:hypothetical protein
MVQGIFILFFNNIFWLGIGIEGFSLYLIKLTIVVSCDEAMLLKLGCKPPNL